MKQNQQHRNKSYRRGQTSRPTVGLFLPRMIWIQQQQWLGVADTIQQQGANLICFDGGELHSPNGFEAQSNVIFELVDAAEAIVDGLIIWTGGLDLYLSSAETQEFYRGYQPLPVVSVERELAGLPSLVVDNKQAMAEAVSHLIEVHGYRQIAFIRGPEGHRGGQERYKGYIEALAEHGLPFDPTLAPPPTHWWSAEEVTARVNLLLDERPSGVEAIVAAADSLVLGVFSALQARQIPIPGDMAVVGFDDMLHIVADPDSIETDLGSGVASFRTVMLPLTTVRMPFYEMGRQAAELVLAQIRGELAPDLVTMPTELIVRRSCGCFSQSMKPTRPEPIVVILQERSTDQAFTTAIATQREHIRAEMKQAMGISTAELGPNWADRLLTAFISEVQGEAENAFLSVLDEMLHASIRIGDSLEGWWPVLFVLRRQTLPYLATPAAQSQAEELWQRTQLLMWEVFERFYVYQQLLAEKRDQMLREVGQKLITTFDIGQLAEVMAQELPTLGIKSCYLALYEPQSQLVNGTQAELAEGKGYPTEWSRSILVYENKERIELEAGEALFLSRQLAPGKRLRREQPYNLVVVPLHFKEQQLGFALFEAGSREGWIYKVLREQLSSALQGALLVEREKRALEKVLAAQRQTQKLATELATVAEVSIAASTILETNQLLQTVVDLTKTRFGLYHAHIYLLNEAGDTLILTAGAGETGRQMVAAGWRIPLTGEQSLVARAARHRQGIIVNDVRQTPDFLPNSLLPDTRAEMTVPMIVGDKVLGVLDVQSEEVNRFTDEDVRIQTTLAAQVAVAVENARLYDQARQEIIERRRAEEELRKYRDHLQAANAELSQYAYVVSHDLQAPLRAIHNYTDFLREDLETSLTGDQKAYLNGLARAVREADQLVKDLLELSRIGHHHAPVETINLGIFLQTLIASFNLPTDIEIEWGNGWPSIETEPTLLRQIFQNLILNAVKFNRSSHKRLELGWRPVEPERYELYVRDNGIGIEPRYQEQIFRVFQRLHTQQDYEGTGIGLAIVQKAVSKLQGTVRVESQPGEGSTFFVTLPRWSHME